MPENLPNYWEIYPVKNPTQGVEWRTHLCDGNNHQILLSSENYKRLKDVLVLVYNNQKADEQEIDFYPDLSYEKHYTVEVNEYYFDPRTEIGDLDYDRHIVIIYEDPISLETTYLKVYKLK